jgi:two-component system, NarL family, invasion response regulator UvrY
MIKVGIVDDHSMVRKGLRDFLSEHVDIQVVGEAKDAREAQELARTVEMDVLIMDLALPGQTGLEILGSLMARAPDTGILVLSSYPEEHFAVSLIRKGAQGYLNKGAEPSQILDAIRTIALGRRYVTAKVAELFAEQLRNAQPEMPHKSLSEREMQVFMRLAKGESVGDVAKGMSLSVKTVSTYRTRLMEKMNLHTNSDLTYYAVKNGLIM